MQIGHWISGKHDGRNLEVQAGGLRFWDVQLRLARQSPSLARNMRVRLAHRHPRHH
jgi:hypothetical protein